MSDDPIQLLNEKLDKIATILAKQFGDEDAQIDLEGADAFVWKAEKKHLQPVPQVNRVDLSLLKGIGHVSRILIENTEQFAQGYSANNALLWGARGMGKSSLVKAVHPEVLKEFPESGLKLIEIHREDLHTLPDLLNQLRDKPNKIILFCDDLSFDGEDTSYKSLKAALDGGVEGRPDNVIFYATSNRRHLIPRDMIENERSTAINPSEATEEKVSLSDRFGLWLGFHKCTQEEYLDIIKGYATEFKLNISDEELKEKALEWSTTRGARSGRVAWQFIQDLGARQNKNTK